ncbi:hypothetical protein [Plantactinospora sp. CA-290183]|uniref:hypothetical protein n=1 Tax=Plantactinospora sp. CA-290183 TaxID=3240006 RepID=UPI003D89B5C3
MATFRPEEGPVTALDSEDIGARRLQTSSAGVRIDRTVEEVAVFTALGRLVVRRTWQW